MREFKRRMEAGAQDRLAVNGSYVHLKSAIGAIKFITDAGEEVTLLEGQGVRFVKGFQGIDVRNEHDIAQEFSVLVGSGDFQNNRLVGEVEIVKSTPMNPVYIAGTDEGAPLPITNHGYAPLQVHNTEAAPMYVRAMDGAALPVYVPHEYYALPVYQKSETPDFRVMNGNSPFHVVHYPGSSQGPLAVSGDPANAPVMVANHPEASPLQVVQQAGGRLVGRGMMTTDGNAQVILGNAERRQLIIQAAKTNAGQIMIGADTPTSGLPLEAGDVMELDVTGDLIVFGAAGQKIYIAEIVPDTVPNQEV